MYTYKNRDAYEMYSIFRRCDTGENVHAAREARVLPAEGVADSRDYGTLLC